MAIPEYPISRIEHYLARANGQNITPPDPISRIEHYLAGIAGGVPQELLDDVANLKSQMDQKAPAIMQAVSNQAIASFADGADDMPLKSLVVAINPVQAGTGDPSPENVRPITGWTGAKVTRCGVNFLHVTATSTTINGVTFTVNNDGSILVNGTATNITALTVSEPNITLNQNAILTGCPNGGGGSTYALQLNGLQLESGNGLEISSNTTITNIRIRIASGTVLDNVLFKPMIRLASVTDETFVPYQGRTVSISWESEAGTVYGGNLDVVSGVLTVNKVYAQLNNSDGWVEYGGSVANYQYTLRFNDRKFGSRAVAASSAFPVFALGLPLSIGWLNADNSPFIGIIDSENVLTLSSLREMASNNEIAIVYELATPQTFHLTPVEVKTLLGQNNIFADTGSVTVVYPADTKTYIDSQIAALQALVLENISNS